MGDVYGSIDYAKLKKVFGRADKAERITVDLATLHVAAPLATLGLRVTIVNKGAGIFTLTLVFLDTTTLSLTNADLGNGDILDWEFASLLITNAPQPGETVDLVVDFKIGVL